MTHLAAESPLAHFSSGAVVPRPDALSFCKQALAAASLGGEKKRKKHAQGSGRSQVFSFQVSVAKQSSLWK